MVLPFEHFKKIFNQNGFRLFMIGSTSRDYLLNRQITDYDFVTDATPDEILKFLDVNMNFAKYGVVKTKFVNKKIDIATLREEFDYDDHRHPNKVKFVKDINIDYKRRDFTINAIYIDENYNIIDPANGLNDLRSKTLRFIKDPFISINEDPLRILRAFRFIKEYNLQIDEKVFKILNDNLELINKLNPDKVEEEKRKMKKYEL